MSQTVTESITAVETMHMKLPAKGLQVPHPPLVAKPKAKLKLDPQRALEPARKKLSTLEAQRIMAVLVDGIRRTNLVTALPLAMERLDNYKVILGGELVQLLEDHRVIIQTFEELKTEAERLLNKNKQEASLPQDDQENLDDFQEEDHLDQDDDNSRPSSSCSISSQADVAMHQLTLVAKQMQYSCKNILRAFANNVAAADAILKEDIEDLESPTEMIGELKELRDILMGMLLTTPVEEAERNDYLKEISERERYNAGIIDKLEAELKAAMDDRDSEIKKKNDVIRRLQADLHQIDKFSEEHIRRTKSEAEKQEAADMKNSDGKRTKLQTDITQHKNQLQTLTQEHRESEQQLRKRKYQIETEVENWIQKFDEDMGSRQDEYEEIDAVYSKEKKQLNELEEKFNTLEIEYKQIMEEHRIARERREAAEREMQMCVGAATTIQAFWRSYKVRKALKSKKKKKGGGKKKKVPTATLR